MKKQLNTMIKKYTYLLLYITLVVIFVFVLAPGIDEVPQVKPLINFIDDNEINAAALYYTDIEEFSIAEINIKNTLDYSPVITFEKKLLKIDKSSTKK